MTKKFHLEDCPAHVTAFGKIEGMGFLMEFFPAYETASKKEAKNDFHLKENPAYMTTTKDMHVHGSVYNNADGKLEENVHSESSLSACKQPQDNTEEHSYENYFN